MPSISSPCIGICTIDRDLCLGCGRSLGEIAAWGSLSEPQRRAIMAELPVRLDGAEARAATDPPLPGPSS